MEKLGINVIGLVAQMANVVILLIVLKKFMYKPLISVLEKRKQMAEDQVKSQEDLDKKIKDLEAKERELTRQAKVKVDELIKQAEAKMKNEREALIKEAKLKAANVSKTMVEAAEEKISRINRDFDNRVTAEAAKLANRALKLLVGSDFQKQITEAQIGKLVKK